MRAVPALVAAAAAAAVAAAAAEEAGGRGGGAGGGAGAGAEAAAAARAAAGSFQLNDRTLQLPAVGPKDPLVYRIQCLRAYLGGAMQGGERAALELVRRVEARRAADSKDLCRTVKACLGEKDRALLPLVFQLIQVRGAAGAGGFALSPVSTHRHCPPLALRHTTPPPLLTPAGPAGGI
jgi:hypothetical protein